MKTTLTKVTDPDAPPPLRYIGAGGWAAMKKSKPLTFIPTGIPRLDSILLGWVNGELILLAGKPGDGKTALAIQTLLTTAQNIGPAAILSLEMKEVGLKNRLLGQLTGLDREAVLRRPWPAKTEKQLQPASDYLAEVPLLIDDRSGLSPERVYKTIISWPAQGVILGAVDYVQLIRSGNDSRAVQVSEAVQAVKEGARDADIPILAICSTNRAAGHRESTQPRLSDLKESGDLEYTADTVLMFHYPDGGEGNENVRAADIHVMKQRNGPTGVVSVQFNRSATRFEPLGGL